SWGVAWRRDNPHPSRNFFFAVDTNETVGGGFERCCVIALVDWHVAGMRCPGIVQLFTLHPESSVLKVRIAVAMIPVKVCINNHLHGLHVDISICESSHDALFRRPYHGVVKLCGPRSVSRSSIDHHNAVGTV